MSAHLPNLLTFDIEEWFHANYAQVDLAACRGQGSNFRRQMDDLLQLCSDTGCKATFFVLGCIGEDYPEVVRAISQADHEVASHGYGHQLAYQQSRAEFKSDVAKSIAILEDLTGQKVAGYRAPSWSIIEDNLHYLEVLEELELVYDASIFPVKTFLYGIPTAPRHIHRPTVNGRELSLYEVPTSVQRLFGQNFGYSGGFYFRVFPQWLLRRFIKEKHAAGENTILYLHPREIDSLERRLQLPWKEHFIHYYGIQGTRKKLELILREFCFTSIADFLQRKKS